MGSASLDQIRFKPFNRVTQRSFPDVTHFAPPVSIHAPWAAFETASHASHVASRWS